MNATGAPTRSEVRVVLANLPPMVTLMVHKFLKKTGMTIVGELTGLDELAVAVRDKRADVVIVPSTASGLAHECYELLQHQPNVKVLTITAMSGHADLFELRLLGTNIGHLEMVDALSSMRKAP